MITNDDIMLTNDDKDDKLWHTDDIMITNDDIMTQWWHNDDIDDIMMTYDDTDDIMTTNDDKIWQMMTMMI